VSWYQNGKTVLDINEARDDGAAVASAGQCANHIALRSRQITTPSPHHSFFCGPDTIAAAQPTESKH